MFQTLRTAALRPLEDRATLENLEGTAQQGGARGWIAWQALRFLLWALVD